MKAVVFDHPGDPAEVLQVRDVPVPVPGFREVRVRMLAAPINPSDLLTIAGRYAKPPQLPATPGYEGVGIVEAAGGGLLGWLRKGKRVAVINERTGTWQEQCVVPAKFVVPVPADVPDEQAAMFFVNPITAVVMVRRVLRVPPGNWLLQTAAGSALGQMVIQLAKRDGFRTINVVRRREQAEELRKIGGDEWICAADEALEERVQQITHGQGVPFVLDPVGGKTGTAAVRTLAVGGRALVYGVLSDQPIEVDPRLMIMGSKRVEGFWLSDWIKRQRIPAMLSIFAQVKRLMSARVIRADIAATYNLDQIRDAARHVQSAARGGKIVLRIAEK